MVSGSLWCQIGSHNRKWNIFLTLNYEIFSVVQKNLHSFLEINGRAQISKSGPCAHA